jgi:hypothetical protein
MKKKLRPLKLKKETLIALTQPNQVVGIYETDPFACTGSLTCPPPNCPSAPYQSCVILYSCVEQSNC